MPSESRVTGSASPNPYRGHRFPREVIALAVRWYLRFALSYRDRGFTRRNLYYARAFYLGYPPGSATIDAAPASVSAGVLTSAPTNVQQAVAQPVSGVPTGSLPGDGPPEPLASLPWGHNTLLLERLDEPALRLWYARQAVAHRWSPNVLGIQVESRLHARIGRADQTTNFAATLPPPQSDLARAVVKDPYNFEFLAVAQGAHERHVEAGLVAHMREFLLELGTGLLYAGNPVPARW